MDNRRFVRSTKGHAEITAQRKTLQGKMRTVLFLVDPKKGADAIYEQVAAIGGPPDALAQLLALGYIEASGEPAAPEATVKTEALKVLDGNNEVQNVQVCKVFMNDTIVDTLGIRAFLFTLRLEKCWTRADLAALLPAYGQALEKKLHAPAVKALVDRAREMLNQPSR